MREESIYNIYFDNHGNKINIDSDFLSDYLYLHDKLIKSKTNKQKLDEIPIDEIERYLRNKKLQNINEK